MNKTNQMNLSKEDLRLINEVFCQSYCFDLPEKWDNDFTQGTARQRYSKLKQHREHFLDRAEECSELTIPSLIQPDGFTWPHLRITSNHFIV